jgi:4-diphosphocytidyl-2-C-methyl-D-erythritol kinase
MTRYYDTCPAKINLGLHIVGRWPNGYHLLETLLVPYPALYDDLELQILPGYDRIDIHISGEVPPSDDENYLAIAYRYLQKAIQKPLPALKVRLHKRIPISAGLGGGSSNAGTFLRLFHQIFPELISLDKLHEVAAQVGSDVPFFLYQRPMLATGTGTSLTPYEIDLSAYQIYLLTPPVPCSTRYIYRGLSPANWSRTPLEPILKQPIESWKDALHNDLEAVSFLIYPTLILYKNALYEAGALYASMNGSGSSLYGIWKAHP